MNTLKNILLAVILVAFLCIVGFIGSLERDLMPLTECFWKSLFALGIALICTYALNRLDD